MRRRIYWLLPELGSARRTMDDLLLARIDESHIHFVGRDGADLTGLHPANLLQTSDLIPAAQHGLMIGGCAGMAIGLLAALLPVGIEPRQAAGIAAALGIAGAAFGAWTASMIGISIPSSRLERFRKALDDGQLLLMIDVPRGRVEEIEALLQAAHPEARFGGEEPNVPAFP
jgi:HAMP domain-containing protein